MNLLQSTVGGHGTAAFTTSGGTSAPISVTIPSTTTPGSLLLVVLTHKQTVTGGSGGPNGSAFNTPTGLGATDAFWHSQGGPTFVSGVNRMVTSLFFIPPVNHTTPITGGTAISTTVAIGATTFSSSELLECGFYEFSGINATFTGGGIVETSAIVNNGTSAVPATASLHTTKIDLVFVTTVGNGSAVGLGSGYSAGLTYNNVGGVAQSQYQLDVPAGTIATGFSGASQPNYGCFALAFLPAPSTGNASYGFFFG